MACLALGLGGCLTEAEDLELGEVEAEIGVEIVSETSCGDGEDNDGDGLTDGDDPDCEGSCNRCLEPPPDPTPPGPRPIVR